MLQGEQEVRFLESAFKQYYYDNISEIPIPSEIARREFGYQRFGGTGMIRHLQFKDAGEMRVMFVRNVPSDAYCSNAYYSFPDMEMANKDWKGADLIFDIDAKDLGLPCRADHTVDVCDECNTAFATKTQESRRQAGGTAPRKPGANDASGGGAADKGTDGSGTGGGDDNSSSRDSSDSNRADAGSKDGNSNGSADNCSHTRTYRRSLPCKKCVSASKEQAALLLDAMHDDLGIPRDAVTTYFSGNDGFHLHVERYSFMEADSRARADLVDYITLRGLIPEALGAKKTGLTKEELPDIGERGWRGRFAKAAFGSKSRRADFVSRFAKNPEACYDELRDVIKEAAPAAGVRIDPGVTMDIHRVFRMPHTLNGKSGMLKVRCDDIDGFDPYEDAVVLGGEPVQIIADCPLRFSLRGRKFGPYHRGEGPVSAPAYVAAYMMCKGLAKTAPA